MRHGRLPLVWGENGKGRQERGKELSGGEWDYQNGMIIIWKLLQTELKFPSQLIILFLFIPSTRYVFPLSFKSTFHLSIGMIHADNLGSAV